jgi:hypothetical protein
MTLWMDRAGGNASGWGSIGTMTSSPLAQDRFEDRLVFQGAGRVNEDALVLGDRAQPGAIGSSSHRTKSRGNPSPTGVNAVTT